MCYRLLIIFFYAFNLNNPFELYHSIYILQKLQKYHSYSKYIEFNDDDDILFDNLYLKNYYK
jgi:hypothetical protein